MCQIVPLVKGLGVREGREGGRMDKDGRADAEAVDVFRTFSLQLCIYDFSSLIIFVMTNLLDISVYPARKHAAIRDSPSS
jgi:hypothetical protein